MIILFLIFFIIFLAFCAFYFLFIFNTILMRGHDLPTSSQAIKKIIEIISEKTRGKNNLNFYDLGSGRGDVLIAIKKAFPQFSVIGIEKRLLQNFFARLKAFLLRQEISFQKNDLFKVNLEKADILYTYLWYDLMPELEKKLQKELKPGTIIITNTSNFPNLRPEKIEITHPKKPDFEKLFVYIKS